MAIKQLVPIEISVLGDGSSTTFVFPAQNLYQNGVGGSNPPVTNGTVPSAVQVPNPPIPVTSATVDGNGNITITFTSAPTNAVQYTFEVDLLFNSGAITSSSAVSIASTNIYASGTALAATGSSLNVNITGGSSGNAAASATGSAVPSSADYVGFNSGGNLLGVSSANPFPVTIISGGAGGTQYTDATAETAGAFTITVAGSYNGTTVVGLRSDTNNYLNTDVQSWAGTALGATANFGTTPGAVKVPGVNASLAVGTVMIAATSNYGTAPSTVAAMGVNAFVTSSATSMSGVIPGSAPTRTDIVGGIYSMYQPGVTVSGNTMPLQLDSWGNQLVSIKAGPVGSSPYYVQSNTSSLGSAGTTATFTFSPSPQEGRAVVISAYFSGTVTGVTCTDNNSVALTANTSNVGNLYQFYGFVGAGVTSYTISWTNSVTAAFSGVVYGGVSGFGNSGNTAFTSTNSPSVFFSVGQGSVLAATFGTQSSPISFNFPTGNIRAETNQGSFTITAGDNLFFSPISTGAVGEVAFNTGGTFTTGVVGLELLGPIAVTMGGVYSATLPTLVTGQPAPYQLTASGGLITNLRDTTTGSIGNTIKAASTAAVATDTALVVAVSPNNTVAENITQIAGSAVSTAATGVQKVGIVGHANAAMDVIITGATAAANALQIAGVYNTSAPTLTNGQGAALQLNASSQLQVDNNALITVGFVPDPGNYAQTLTSSEAIDANGNAISRSAVFTDEGSFRDDFSGAALTTTIGANITTTASSAIVTSVSPEFGNGNGTAVKIGQYIKISSDPEADWGQVAYIVSPSSVQLAANYAGTATTAAGQVSNWKTLTGTGGSFAVASSILTIASGTTASAFTGIIGAQADYLPLLLQTYVEVSQRIVNETVVFGFQDTLSITPNYACVVSLTGTVNTTGNFVTQSSSAATDIQTTAFTYPNGTTSATYHTYSISLSANQATLLIDNIVVATNTLHIPGPYNAMQVVYYTANGGTAPGSTTSLLVDYAYFIDSDRVQIDDDFVGEPLVVSAAVQQANSQLTYSQGMPAQLQMDILGNLKVAENASLDSFGDIIHCVRNSQWQQDFSEGQNAALTALTGTTGTATYSNGSVTIATTAAASTSANLQSTFGMNYRVSHEWYFYFTATFTTGVANSHQRIGALTGIVNSPQNGVCVGFEGTTFGVSYFKAGTGQGSFAANSAPSVARSAFNGDQCTGAAGSRFTQSGAPTALNLNNLNLYRLRGGWLGAASVVLEVFSPDGNWVVMHTIVVPNQGTLPWTYATNWNYQAEVLNSTNATNITMTMGGGAFGTTESVYTDNTSNTINITAADAASTTAIWANGQNAISGTPTANSAAVFPIVGASALRVQMSGTLVGTVVTEASTDGGQTWQAQYVHLTGTSSEASTFTGAVSPNTNFEGSTIAAGFTHFRVRCTTFTSGTGTVLVRSTVNPASLEVIAPVFTATAQNFTTGTVWASGTTSGTVQVIDSPGSGVQPQAYMVQLDQGSGISAGAITFQVTADGINWVTIPANCVIDPATLLPITLPYTLVASTNRAFKIILYGYTGLRLSVSTTTAGGSVTPYWATVNMASVSTPLGVYNSTPPTLTAGQQAGQQFDTTGSLYINTEGRKQTYAAAAIGFTPIATTTGPTFSLTGSSTKTVRITKIRVSCSAATGGVADISLKRFSALSGGTSAAVANIGKLDTNNATATAAPLTWSVVATTATVAGVLRSERYEIVTPTATAGGPELIEWNFGIANDQALVLRGTGDFMGILFSSVATTPVADIWVEWTEE